ncbi:MAG: ABC transporter permease [Dehalococcoidia bacterium]|nr:ABC transporter permease [Dehalococcoidia bacterium]
MGLLIARRLGMAVPTLLGVTAIIFLLMSVLPGDPLAGLLSQEATAEDRARLEASLGLDRPLPVRYVTWLGDIAQGDFGYSPYRRRDVAELLGTAFKNTLRLALPAAALGVTFGVALGAAAAANRGRAIDRAVSMIAMGGISVPSYWIAILLIIVFSANLRWLPAGGMGGQEGGVIDAVKHLIMPAVASAFVSVGQTARMMRASLVETYGQDFVDTLRAKGLNSRQILFHVGKNALSPVLTVIGLQVGFLLGGSVLIETIFSWPGLGQLIFQAIAARDFKVIQAGIVVIATTFVLMNLTVDLLQMLVDPRLRKAT